MDTAKAVSQALKGIWGKCARYDAAKVFADRMWKAECRVREWGCDLPQGPSPIARCLVNALCFGFGDEHNRKMIKKYHEARIAAERFCRPRRRR
jgi:hypothetical protein